MAIITPNSDLWLCRTKLSPDMKHIVKFATVAEQTTYFTSTAAVSRVEGGSYTFFGSQKENYIRVGVNADTIHDINYIAYRNTTHTDKIFYAFVTEIRYLSANSAAIYFEIDPWQTWQFDLTFNQSFIIREHTDSDIPGEHILDEGLTTGDYVELGTRAFGADELCIVVATTTTSTTFTEGTFGTFVQANPGTVYYGTYSGSTLIWFELTQAGIDLLATLLEALTENGKEDAISSIYMAPKILMKFRTSTPSTLGGTEILPWIGNYVGKIAPGTLLNSFDGYQAKNAKLFSYPYTCLTAYNNLGDSVEYPLEYFWWNTTEPLSFEVYGTANGAPEMVLVPTNYKDRKWNWHETLELKGYPMVNWQYDAFKGWLAKNSSTQLLQIAGAAASIGLAAFSGGGTALASPGMLAGGGIMGILNSINTIGLAGMKPNTVKGSHSTVNTAIASGFSDFYIAWKMIRRNYAEIIDQYFTLYGYKVNRLGTPNFNARPYYTYLQMNDPNITGFIPPDDLMRIKKVFSEGVTVWKNPLHIMNYATYGNLNSIMLSPLTLSPQSAEPSDPATDLSSFTGGTSEGGGGRSGGGVF